MLLEKYEKNHTVQPTQKSNIILHLPIQKSTWPPHSITERIQSQNQPVQSLTLPWANSMTGHREFTSLYSVSFSVKWWYHKMLCNCWKTHKNYYIMNSTALYPYQIACNKHLDDYSYPFILKKTANVTNSSMKTS